jgi:uncharacterized membrane protein
MRKFIKLLFILLFISLNLKAQFGISGNIGYGSYSMDNLKGFNVAYQNQTSTQFNLKLDQLENFPMFWNFSFETFYRDSSNIRISLVYTYLSTGSRLYYEDYSGEISFDNITVANVLGIKILKSLINLPLDFGLYINPQILLNKNCFNYSFSLNLNQDHSAYNKTKGKAINVGTSAGFFLKKRINKFEINFEAGYYLDIYKGAIKAKVDGTKYEMKNRETNTSLKYEWTGFRGSIGISYFLKFD